MFLSWVSGLILGGNTSDDYGHKGAFYKVFSQGTARNHNQSDLKAYQHCNSAGVCSAVSAITANEDEYEQLARAIAEYNINPGSKSWPSTLKNKKLADCRSCEYSIDVRNSSDKFNLPYRAYIWKGGNYPADLTDENGNPDPKAGTEWCFKYGEEEWVDGKEFSKIDEAARGDLLADPPIQPQGRINCTTGDAI